MVLSLRWEHQYKTPLFPVLFWGIRAEAAPLAFVARNLFFSFSYLNLSWVSSLFGKTPLSWSQDLSSVLWPVFGYEWKFINSPS